MPYAVTNVLKLVIFCRLRDVSHSGTPSQAASCAKAAISAQAAKKNSAMVGGSKGCTVLPQSPICARSVRPHSRAASTST